MTAHTAHDLDTFARADRTAQEWLDAVAAQLDTEDRHFAYRVLRAWLRTVRDRLTVEAASHFAAQLPMLLRGLFFDGWNPSRVPVKYDAEQFLIAVAKEAKVSPAVARRAAAAVTVALAGRCSPGQLDHLLAQLPGPLRELLDPTDAEANADTDTDTEMAMVPAEPPAGDRWLEVAERIDRVEREVGTVVEALRALVHGFEERPSAEARPERLPAAARQAHDILLTLTAAPSPAAQ